MKIEKTPITFHNIFVFSVVDPTKKLWSRASASTFTIIPGGNVRSAKTISPLARQSLFYDHRCFPWRYSPNDWLANAHTNILDLIVTVFGFKESEQPPDATGHDV